MQADRVGPEGDMPPRRRRAEPDLLPADPQVPPTVARPGLPPPQAGQRLQRCLALV
jgi:hypothetical protein